MPLTDSQLQARQHTLGASEAPAVCGMSPWTTPLDIWSRKARGIGGAIPPLILPTPSTGAAAMGHRLEGVIADLYCEDRGVEVHDVDHTYVHTEHRWASATPDRIVRGTDIGVECKLVGPHMVGDWRDGVPDYVVIQAMWQSWVCGFDRVDVAALIGGTSFAVEGITRDDSAIDDMVGHCDDWWQRHVVGNVAPPATDHEDARRMLTASWAQDNGQTIIAPPDATDVAAELAQTRDDLKALKAREGRLKTRLMAMIGDAKSIKGDWGRASWGTVKGSPSWKSIAEDLSRGMDPDELQELIAEHTSAPYRKFGFYPKRKKTT